MYDYDLDMPFYPSMSLTDWTTGTPNARYWVLKLLSEHIKPGMDIQRVQDIREDTSEIFCVSSDSRNGYPDLVFKCKDLDATLTIEFASFGTPYGVCGNYTVDDYCHDHSVLQYISRECNDKNSCTIQVFPLPWLDPCKGYVETVRAQARCSKGKGYATPADTGDTSVFAVKSEDGKTKNVVVINHRNEVTMVSIDAGSFEKASMWVVDKDTPGESGPTEMEVSSLDRISLGAFATAFISIKN